MTHHKHPDMTQPLAFLEANLLSPALMQVMRDMGIESLTPIQAESIPVLLQGKDLIGQSKTGSGKTAAFTLPILEKLELHKRSPQALVLCPTRELCAQVAREIRKFGRSHAGLHVMIMAGGQPVGPQLGALEKGVHIVVGTPGRVLDHVGRGSLDFHALATVVLDEADRMLDMGFQDDMQSILQATPMTRQTVLFSATFPQAIESMSLAYQKQPVRVTIGEARRSAPLIRQFRLDISEDRKFAALQQVFRQYQPLSALVFCNQKTTVAALAESLAQAGVSVSSLHGDLEQYERDRAMARFRNQSAQVLIATDVAARGIDIHDMPLVVNFDMPLKPDMYVHRVGRTGRAGKAGLAISLVTRRDRHRLGALEEALGMTLEALSLEDQRDNDKVRPAEVKTMETLYISGGRKEKLRPGDILGALTGEAAGLQASDIGKIEIHDHFSYVAVTKSLAGTAVARLSAGHIKGRRFRVEIVR